MSFRLKVCRLAGRLTDFKFEVVSGLPKKVFVLKYVIYRIM